MHFDRFLKKKIIFFLFKIIKYYFVFQFIEEFLSAESGVECLS